ncbi:MAG: hypothetical protein FJY74_05125 [Candidatus Eisenbacteria bacterium]|nr:hypothetical protein [Candidatus Eisenbacteria bacterium]
MTLCALICLVALAAAPRPPADVPLSHWAYPLLERLASRGVLDLDLTTRPVSRAAVADALRAADADEASRAAELTERESWAIDRLRAEFLRAEVDAPVFSARDEAAAVGLGVRALTSYERAAFHDDADDGRPDVSVTVSYDLWGGVSDAVGFYSEADVVLGGQEGARTERLSSRARTWRGVAATAELAYLKLERPGYSVAVGRRDPAWGRSERGRLLISGSAATMDELEARFTVGPWSFLALHGLLERPPDARDGLGEDERVFLAAHRVSVRGALGSISVSEAVVYSSVMPDPVYLNPLVPFYLSQHNERSDDNVLWALDFLARPRRGLDLYGEFVVDDLQYERSTGHPDKYGATVGLTAYAAPLGIDAEITAEYSNVRKWTYTHQLPWHAVAQDGKPLGFELGPDADRLTLEVTAHPSPAWSVGVSYSRARKGEGTIVEPFEQGSDPDPSFPSGVVETTDRVGVECSYENLDGLRAFLSAAGVFVRNRDHGPEDDHGWEVRAGIGFRI